MEVNQKSFRLGAIVDLGALSNVFVEREPKEDPNNTSALNQYCMWVVAKRNNHQQQMVKIA